MKLQTTKGPSSPDPDQTLEFSAQKRPARTQPIGIHLGNGWFLTEAVLEDNGDGQLSPGVGAYTHARGRKGTAPLWTNTRLLRAFVHVSPPQRDML